ncbi:MAG TPA: RcnB family protein [Caulobacter sp.]|nr:RcnB family protein [Caulobacter sp.]
MKKILTAAIALSVLASAGAASAQSYRGRPAGYQQGYDAPRGDRRDERRDERRDDRGDRRDERRDDRYDRRYENRYERRAERRYNAGRYHAPRGYQARHWRQGEHLPPQYRGQAYRVDYRYYRLPPPPRGYQYTRVNDDVVLTAIATGLIASVVFNMFQ